jgi:hypothetical protein
MQFGKFSIIIPVFCFAFSHSGETQEKPVRKADLPSAVQNKGRGQTGSILRFFAPLDIMDRRERRLGNKKGKSIGGSKS